MRGIRNFQNVLSKNNNRGYMTAEAAIALPIFLCAVLTFIILIKVIFVHEVMQHALDQATYEIAEYSYLYGVSGIDELVDFSEITDNFLLDMLFDKGMDEFRSEIFAPVGKKQVEKFLSKRFAGDLDSTIKNLGVVNGTNGLEVNTSLFEDETNEISIVLKYDIDIPIPIKLIPSFHIEQRAAARAWMSGDIDEFELDSGYWEEESDPRKQEDIWSLGNLERGRKIRSIFGGNLPLSFPVIANYSNGKAKMIKSMDLTCATYQRAVVVSRKLAEYIDELNDFEGLQIPWGSKKIGIPYGQITSKQLLLVIPSNTCNPLVENALQNACTLASSKGITMTIVRYGFKQT